MATWSQCGGSGVVGRSGEPTYSSGAADARKCPTCDGSGETKDAFESLWDLAKALGKKADEFFRKKD
jgi:hypothetical protein